MYCKHCGYEIDNDSTFCKACGQKIDVTVAQEANLDKPKSTKRIPRGLFWILAIILIAGAIIIFIPKGGKGFLNLHEGMTKGQVHYSLGSPLYADPDYESYVIYNFYGYNATVKVFYDDDGKLDWATATINQIDINDYDSIFESVCDTLGNPIYCNTSKETAYPRAEWNVSTPKYHKYVSISFGSSFDTGGECTMNIDGR